MFLPAAQTPHSRIESALRFWAEQVGQESINSESIRAAVEQVNSTRTALLAELARQQDEEQEVLMLRKLKKLGPCKFRALMRKYAKQRTEVLQPVLDRLRAKGAIIVGVSGDIFVVLKEGENSSGFSIVTC